MLITNLILLIIAFTLLIKGAGFLIDGASSLAKRLGVSPLVIGLTVVALGTSAPELVVNLFASLKGANEIALGNVIGSNIFNMLFILGSAAMVFPISVTRGTTWKEVPLAFLVTGILFLLCNDRLIDGDRLSVLNRTDGLILLSFFIIFLYYTIAISKNQSINKIEDVKNYKLLISVLMIIGGLIMLVLGGRWAVSGATAIARFLGMSEALIGLTIVAIGTSLPELFTSVVAAYKKNSDIAMGNIVGSNIFNILFILGVSAIINPISFINILNTDLMVAAVMTAILFIFLLIGRKHVLQRWQGALFIIFYIIYLIFLIQRG